MNISDLAEDYLIDRKEGMRKLTASFLNEVMHVRLKNKSRPDPTNAPARERRIAMEQDRDLLKTIHGEIELDKPQIREFPFKTKVFERFSRVEESVRVAVAESYLEGVSTRKVEKVFSKFGLDSISASEVSRIAKKLDKLVKEFLNRPIVGSIPYLFLDASYFKVRTDGQIYKQGTACCYCYSRGWLSRNTECHGCR